MDPDNELEFEFPPVLRFYKSGRVERFDGTDVAPASADPTTGVTSKDVLIDPAIGLAARLYLPILTSDEQQQQPKKKKLPILVFFHGGAFLIHTAASPGYHRYMNSLVASAQVVAVSVTYRLAPEHRLPTAYDDSWAALKWVASIRRSGAEPWLAEHGDFGRVFLAGDSAGGNIAHNMATRIGAAQGSEADLPEVKGVVLMDPYFAGKDPVGSEPADAAIRDGLESAWSFVCGGRYGIDHPLVNPIGSPEDLRALGCGRVLVTVAELDFFRDRGRAYVEALRRSGWPGEAELHEAEGEKHVYFLSKPESEKAVREMEAVVFFLNRD